MRLQDTRQQDITDLFLGCFAAAAFVTLNRQAPSPICGDYDPLCAALARIALGHHLPRDDWDISAARGRERRSYSSTANTGSTSKAYAYDRFTHRTRS